MTSLMRAMVRLNDQFIRIYPSEFRHAFGDELREVYAAAIVAHGSRGWHVLLRFFLRECMGWGRTMFVLHFRGIASKARAAVQGGGKLHPFIAGGPLRRRVHMLDWISVSKSLDEGRFSAWLAGAPLLLFGLGIALNALIGGGPWYEVPRWRLYLGVAIGLLPMLAIGVGALIALARRIPDWGWTWIGGVFMGIVIFLKTLVEEMADEGKPLTTPGGELVLALVILLIGGVLVLAAALRGWRRAGLLSLGFSGIFGLTLFQGFTAGPFFRHDLALLAAPFGIVAAGLVVAFVRGSDSARFGVILGLAALNAGVVVMGSVVWREWLARQGGVSPTIPLLVLSTAMLIAGPLAGWMVRPIRNAFGGAS